MKVGDYVRFYDRDCTEIGKIVGEVEDSHLKVVKCKDDYYDLDNFIKSSPNIIDLIEVGDYVNGHKVIYTAGEKHKLVYVEYVNMSKLLEVKSYQIKSIVTKEQFERMEYKIGD